MSIGDFERARSAQAKQVRTTAILDAARDLATEHGVRAVTLTDVAAAVGLHKSALLRYFETREQIFLLLTAEGWTQWSADLRPRIESLPAFDRPRSPATQARTISTSLTTRPLFCDLLAHTPLNLERNVSTEALRSFKLTALAESAAIGTCLRRHAPLTPQQARNVVATATGMAGALWQMAAPGTSLRDLYERDPDLRHAVVDVGPRLTEILTGLIAGYSGASRS